ncbi:uncharacterized protein ACA1_042990 [Acanthamoeba castellanii str. Neff]|uniref:Uncharacterized protein n=1 Tax=Acanthamoeba castellanii (strain ATCC 30010 / Neff) TaxID=1257118 RepID=L8GWD0_ACACF|nr:uncharacterized protein ACA1_042990 [Acanthamoeba castellanii str. Neff]ELR16898.1 hypothetical protein ACA1_042990 [Acanthamoeba castellanii str. Neff]
MGGATSSHSKYASDPRSETRESIQERIDKNKKKIEKLEKENEVLGRRLQKEAERSAAEAPWDGRTIRRHSAGGPEDSMPSGLTPRSALLQGQTQKQQQKSKRTS